MLERTTQFKWCAVILISTVDDGSHIMYILILILATDWDQAMWSGLGCYNIFLNIIFFTSYEICSITLYINCISIDIADIHNQY
jgi:hypothetical protein